MRYANPGRWRALPPGCWISFGNFPFEASNEDFQQFLRERGIDLPIESISVSKNGYRVCAVVSVQSEPGECSAETFYRVQNLIDGDLSFCGRELNMFCPAAQSRGGQRR